MIIEGTVRDSDVVAATMTGLREAGYEIEARALAVNFRFSALGILQRYESQKADRGGGRMTTPAAHQAAYEGLPVTLARIEAEKLADRVTIYRRGADILYQNEVRDGQWIGAPQAAAIVLAERARPLSPAEAAAYAESLEKLAAMLRAPGRKATAEDIDRVEMLRRAAALE